VVKHKTSRQWSGGLINTIKHDYKITSMAYMAQINIAKQIPQYAHPNLVQRKLTVAIALQLETALHCISCSWSATEIAGVENAAPDCRGGKRGSSIVWKAEVSVISHCYKCVATATRTNVNQKDFTHWNIGIVSPYLTQTRFKRQLPSFDATT